MSHEASRWAYQQNIPFKAKFVLTTFADQANDAGHVCYQQTNTAFFVKKLGMSERSFYRCICALVRQGYLTRNNVRGSKEPEYGLCIAREPSPIEEWKWMSAKLPEDSSESQDDQDTTSSGSDTCVGPQNVTSGPTPVSDRSDTCVRPYIIEENHYTNARVEKPLDGFSRTPPPIDREPTKPEDELVWVARGTRWWSAMDRWWRKVKGSPLGFAYNGEGQYRAQTGRWFKRSDLDAALKTGPPSAVNQAAADEFAHHA
jgi:hypothetical protein